MAATLAEVLKDPNYVNANAATKAAIFDKFSAKDPNYTNANDATKLAIRTKFGVVAPAPAPMEAEPAADSIPQRNLAQQIGYPVLEAGLSTIGGIVGGVPATIFGPAGTVAGAATGAGLGYAGAKEIEKLIDTSMGQRKAQPLANEALDAAKNTLVGAIFEVGGRALIPPAAKAAGWVWDAASGRLAQIKAGKIVQELAGPELEALKAATAKAPKGVTAGQAIAGVDAPPLQTLATRAAEKIPYEFRPVVQAQEAGRIAALKGATPDKAVAEAARAAASEPLYRESTKAVIAIDPELKAIFNRLPEGTINAAKELAKREGRPFIFGESVPGVEAATRVAGAPQITGESLHYIKRALSDIANSQATKNVGVDAQRATQGVLTDFLSAVESRVPAYGQAREAFRVGSEPVNQAVVLNEMRKILSTPEGKESAKPFLNALGKGEQALLKKATGYARYQEGDLAKVLTPNQMATVTDIADQLVRNSKMAEQSKAGATMYEDIIRTETKKFPRINLLRRDVTLANETLDALETKLNKKVMAALVNGMKSGQSLNEMLNSVPAAQRSIVLQAFQKDPLVQRSVSTSVNALAQ
jgi:hypothetical protein